MELIEKAQDFYFYPNGVYREQNKVIAKKLEQYKKIYKRLKNKALILNLK
jgi:hypothetical protein